MSTNPFDSRLARALITLDFHAPQLHALWVWLWHQELARMVRRAQRRPHYRRGYRDRG